MHNSTRNLQAISMVNFIEGPCIVIGSLVNMEHLLDHLDTDKRKQTRLGHLNMKIINTLCGL